MKKSKRKYRALEGEKGEVDDGEVEEDVGEGPEEDMKDVSEENREKQGKDEDSTVSR